VRRHYLRGHLSDLPDMYLPDVPNMPDLSDVPDVPNLRYLSAHVRYLPYLHLLQAWHVRLGKLVQG
jgi:hypothetical protein